MTEVRSWKVQYTKPGPPGTIEQVVVVARLDMTADQIFGAVEEMEAPLSIELVKISRHVPAILVDVAP